MAAVYGGDSYTARRATYSSAYHRATQPPPLSISQMKDQEPLCPHDDQELTHCNSQALAKGLQTKSVHESLVHDGQNAVDLVKQFLEVRPVGTLVTMLLY
jgi:hypothetical protein